MQMSSYRSCHQSDKSKDVHLCCWVCSHCRGCFDAMRHNRRGHGANVPPWWPQKGIGGSRSCMFSACALHALCVRTASFLHACWMFSTCVQRLFCMLSVCFLYAFCVFSVCVLHGFVCMSCMSSACVLHMFCVFVCMFSPRLCFSFAGF